MNKKILSGILCGALLIASASAFVSCKDYDDDITEVQKQIDDHKKDADQKFAELNKVVKENMDKVQGQIATLDAQIKAVDEAYKIADANLKALIEQEAAARAAADAAMKDYVDAQAAAAKDYTDAAKAEALAAAKAAQDAAQKFADEAAAALAQSEANAAATYATKVELEAARAQLQLGIDKAQADATSALAKYDELTQTLNDKLAELKAAYEAADAKLKADLQDEIANLKAQLAVEVAKLADADAELEKKIVEANGKIKAAEDEIKTLKNNVASLESALKNLSDVTIPEVKKALEDAKKELSDKIAALEKKEGEDVAALQKALDGLTADLALTNKAVAALQANLDTLKEEVGNLKTRIADMEGAITGVKNDLAAALVLFNAFKAETSDNFLEVWDSVAGLDARCVAIEAKAVVLENSLNETKVALQALADKEELDVAALYQKIADEKGAILSKMEADIATAKAELTAAYIAADKVLEKLINDTKTELEGKITAAITTCKAYTDDKIAALKEYVDAQDLKDQGYTDQEIARLQILLEDEIALGDAQTLLAAKDYTDAELAKAVQTLTAMINDEIANRIKAIDALKTLLQDEIAKGDAKTLTDAKAYADAQDAALKAILEQAIEEGDTAVARAAQAALNKVENALRTLVADTKSELLQEISKLDAAIKALEAKEGQDYTELLNLLKNTKTELETAISTGDAATLASAKAYADAQLAAAKLYTDGEISTLKTTMQQADAALGVRIDNVIDAYQAADSALQANIDTLEADINSKLGVVNGRLTDLEDGLAELNTEFAKVKEDASKLITSIVYQGSHSMGSWSYPVVDGQEPLIYYATQYADHNAWPYDSILHRAPALHEGHDVFQYQKGYLFATVNPSSVDMTGIKLDLENSQGDISKYFELDSLKPSDVLITRGGTSTGLYKMALLPRYDSNEDNPQFNFTQVKNDKVLYAMAANWENAQGDSVKVSATYGLTHFENFCEVYPSARSGMKAHPEFKFYTDDDYNNVQPGNVKFSHYEYTADKVDDFPTAYLKLDNQIKQWNYKWYVEFFEYTDNAWVPANDIDPTKMGEKLDPTKIFADYTDEALDSVTFTKSFTLKDADYINKRILVRVRAINYLYEQQTAECILSFARPLFNAVTLKQDFYPGHKENLDLSHSYARFFFAQQLMDSLGLEATKRYNDYAEANGAKPTVVKTSTGIILPNLLLDWKLLGNGCFDLINYDPKAIGYNADYAKTPNDSIVLDIKDNAGHQIIKVTMLANIKTPYHLDYQIIDKDGNVANRIPASFDFKHKVPGVDEPISVFPDSINKDMILVWAGSNPVISYDLKSAFLKLGDYVPDASTQDPQNLSVANTTGTWTRSNGSVFMFKGDATAETDLTIANNYVGHEATVSVKVNAKSLTLFGSTGVQVQVAGANRPLNAFDPVPYNITRRISYYNCGLTDRYFSAATDAFKMAFVSPINYGIYRAATDVEEGQTYTIEYSLVNGANSITFENVFPDYSKITSGEPYKFGLKDARIASADFKVTDTNNPNYALLRYAVYVPAERAFKFTYDNPAAINSFTLPCKLDVTDIYGVTTSFNFNLKFLPHSL